MYTVYCVVNRNKMPLATLYITDFYFNLIWYFYSGIYISGPCRKRTEEIPYNKRFLKHRYSCPPLKANNFRSFLKKHFKFTIVYAVVDHWFKICLLVNIFFSMCHCKQFCKGVSFFCGSGPS
jgi:hypothetical protein